MPNEHETAVHPKDAQLLNPELTLRHKHEDVQGCIGFKYKTKLIINARNGKKTFKFEETLMSFSSTYAEELFLGLVIFPGIQTDFYEQKHIN